MLPKVVKNLRIDMNLGQVRKSIAINQNSSLVPTLNFYLVDAGSPINLDDLLYAEIFIYKADNHEAINGCVIDGDSIQYSLHSTDVSALGINKAQLQLTWKDGSVAITPTFEIVVYQAIVDESVQRSQNEYTSLSQMLVQANDYKDAAAASAENAAESAEAAEQTIETVNEYATSASEAASEAATYSSNAQDYASSASEAAAAAASEAVVTSNNVDNTSEYAQAASERASEAAVYKSETINYMNSTSEYVSSASEYAAVAGSNAAITSADKSETANYLASTSQLESEAASETALASEYADEAESWYRQAETIAEGFEGTLIPMGTITFSQLPAIADAHSGWMYNISDEFTTTSDFLEGSGYNVPAGSNIYLTSLGKWDVLAGSPVTGVKGDDEQYYRRGNVNITPSNIGLGNVRNEDIGADDISAIAASVKAAILVLSGNFVNYQPKLTDPLTKSDVVNDLVTATNNVPLSAAQGKALKDLIGDLTTLTTTATSDLVSAINELDSRIISLENQIGYPISRA